MSAGEGAGEPVRLLIADDDQLLRAGLRLLLETQPDLRVVGEARTGAEAVRLAERVAADVALVDVRMPDGDGIEVTRRLVAAGLPVRVLVLTTFDEDDSLFAAVRAGAAGFLLKRSRPEELIAAVRAVAAGEAVITPAMTRHLLREFTAATPPPVPAAVRRRLDRLTTREREALLLLARGASTAEIATALHVGEATAKTHVRHLLEKLEVRDRVAAVVLAFDCGLVRPHGAGWR